MRQVDVAIIGAGSAGLTALGLIKKVTNNYVLINEGWYGTTCAKVGCMPSKVLIQIADDFDRLKKLPVEGIEGVAQAHVNGETVMKRVQSMRDGFVEKTIAPWQTLPADKNLNGRAAFIDANTLEVTYSDGQTEQIQAKQIILAPGSRPVLPAAWQAIQGVVTSDTFFEQASLPKKVAVIGLGVIGLELGQAMARLGVEVVGIEMADTLAGISDPEVRNKALELLGHDFPLYLGQAAQLEPIENGVKVSVGEQSIEVDQVLAALGRRPNLDTVNLANAGITLDEQGMPEIDSSTMRIQGTSIYVAGDATGQKAILHEAADEGRIAAYNVIQALQQGEAKHYQARTELGMAFTHPNIGFFGKRFVELDPEHIAIGSYNFNMLGRPRVMQETEGLIRLYADKKTKQLVGGEMIAPRGEHLLHQLAWVHQLNVEIAEILRLPFYHPNIEEGVRMALRELAKQLYDKPVEEVIGA
ncbi:dihydrolipoyl dehydrogenase [Marinomonas ostreistagni]|uniref:Dihydrolipoyl dehydrogenase n=1 Tax=Marinomonas ostreistagni TaxID=359209 RepID=A0ABS0ZB36_9GAMM|nr:dihydrolipoyl dehydrogenase [Marinomonas ostreistagni]MBJ7550873.1 dihydrolipoyl dehydrogenase [Marinomonas ostreistagni]